MANKTKRRSVSSNVNTQGESAIKTSKSSGHTFTQEFNPDYSFVKQDLKRIGILLVVFIVILVVLSFVLR
jgi:hypothetical protein